MAWQSLVDVNLNTGNNPGMCLAFAEDAVGAPHGLPTAKSAWDAANDKHWGDYNLPDAVCAVFWSWVGDLGEGPLDYGHVCIWVPGMGLFSSPKRWSDGWGNAWYGSIDECSRWLGASYLGWTSDLNGLQLAQWVGDATPAPAPAPAPSDWNATYTVQPGDSLSTIADQYGITWNDLYAVNSGVIGGNPDFIIAGQVLAVPGAAPAPAPEPAPAPAPEPTPEPTPEPVVDPVVDPTTDASPESTPESTPIPEETPVPELSQADKDKMMAQQAALVAKIQPADLGNIITNPVTRKVVWAIYGLTGLFIIGIMGGLTAAQWIAPEWFIFATGAYTAISPAFASLAMANISTTSSK